MILDAGEVLFWAAAAVVGVLGGARLVRLVVHDDFPPMKWLRWQYLQRTIKSDAEGRTTANGWDKLITCHWCFAPYAIAVVFASAYFLNFSAVWWIGWGWAAASYLASMVVERDEKD